jgi:class 3 adenylate cyclase
LSLQVFLLLETLFHAFDEIAKKRKVFKVETVGDCYVAVAGLPEIRKDHALVMARFARECMLKMRTLVRKLEVNFGEKKIGSTFRVARALLVEVVPGTFAHALVFLNIRTRYR